MWQLMLLNVQPKNVYAYEKMKMTNQQGVYHPENEIISIY